MKRLMAVVLGAALIAGAGGAAAFGGGRHGGWDDYAAGLRGVYQLDDLTPEQRQQIDALRGQLRQDRDQRRAQRQELRDAIQRGDDVEAIRPLAERQGREVTEQIIKRAEARAKLNQILTPQQQERLQSVMQRCDRGGWM